MEDTPLVGSAAGQGVDLDSGDHLPGVDAKPVPAVASWTARYGTLFRLIGWRLASGGGP